MAARDESPSHESLLFGRAPAGVALAALAVIVSGCAGLATYQPRNAEEAIRVAKEVGGTGCYYARIKGNARPYADVEVVSIVVTTIGKSTKFEDCLNALPPEQRSLVAPQ